MLKTHVASQEILATNCNKKILCCYTNTTHQIQVIQIKTIPSSGFERVVFPGQRLMFHAVVDADLTINTSRNNQSLIPCKALQVTEDFDQ